MNDEIADLNRRHWEKMVQEGCGFTLPWLELDPEAVRQFARGALQEASWPLSEMYPRSVLAGLEGKQELCLASGGGQQSAVFGLSGAQVTVVDLAEGQLAGDRQAAAHYGYPLKALQADMRDLSILQAQQFDLVYQAPSISYVPEVRAVYAQVFRVLKPGGIYRVEFCNPATQFVDLDDWDGKGYHIHTPYAVRRIQKEGREAADFRHYLSDIFNGLIELGFMIRQVQEAPYHFRVDPQAVPGSWEHWLTYVQSQFAVVAAKPPGS